MLLTCSIYINFYSVYLSETKFISITGEWIDKYIDKAMEQNNTCFKQNINLNAKCKVFFFFFLGESHCR